MERFGLGICALLLWAGPVFGQTSLATNSPTPLSTRVTAYAIDAKVDTEHHSLDASETVSYKNLTGQSLTTVPFHLYLNAFRPESTFTSETHFGGGIRDSEASDEYPKEKRGSITVSRISADGEGELQLRYTAPDDGNALDHTVAEVTLPRPLAPGDTITFHMQFHDQFPVSVARNGWKRDMMMGGQWYPKPGVFWQGAWNCHQYHATTEFFSDFGTFRVALTVPKRYVVGASGVPTGEQTNGDSKTLSFYGEDIGDFAWAASPRFVVTTGTFLSSMGPVQIRVLAHASHPGAGERYLKVLLATMKQFDTWYGPYPYKVLTLIDPEPDSEMLGMEYPTLITGGTSNFDLSHFTEVVSEHEFGHQYWYGMVATNEFEDAWLDEGINQYTEGNVMGALYGQRTSILDLPWASFSDVALNRMTYLGSPDSDPVVRHAWQFRNAGSYGDITYGKTATMLKTLEGLIGEDTMLDAMHTYFMRYRFTHPTGEDFLQTIEEVAVKHGRATRTVADMTGLGGMVTLVPGRDAPVSDPLVPGPLQAAGTIPPKMGQGSSLRPFFNQAVYGTQVLDYTVDSMASGPVEWWLPEKKQTTFRDTVTVRRKGDFVLPVTLEVVFADGSKLRERWDGADRWHRFTYVRGAKIASAEIDPDHTVLLDRDLFNNSKTETENPSPARKLTILLMSELQFLEESLSWIV